MFIHLTIIMKNKPIDELQKRIIAFYKEINWERQVTLKEVADNVWVSHSQTVLNKLNQLVFKWYFVKEGKKFRLVKEELWKSNDVVQLPIYWFAQCWNKGKRILDEYTQESIPVTWAFLGVRNLDKCFFVRANWDSMEPEISNNDLLLIHQQDTYEEWDKVFVLHNQLPKIKKIVKQDGEYFLKSTNPLFEKVKIDPYDETKIIGVVKKVIKNY